MRHRPFLPSLGLALLLTSLPSWAIEPEAGQLQPKLNRATILFPNTTVDLVPFTSASGNLKGIHCLFDPAASNRTQQIDIYVNDNSVQTLHVTASDYPKDSTGAASTGFIPMNVRFDSSLRVQLKRTSSPGVSYLVTCVASWAQDGFDIV